jgi:hypothetical protein
LAGHQLPRADLRPRWHRPHRLPLWTISLVRPRRRHWHDSPSGDPECNNAPHHRDPIDAPPITDPIVAEFPLLGGVFESSEPSGGPLAGKSAIRFSRLVGAGADSGNPLESCNAVCGKPTAATNDKRPPHGKANARRRSIAPPDLFSPSNPSQAPAITQASGR